MIAYASRSQGDALRHLTKNGWRQLIEPSHLEKQALRKRGPELRFMIDNGAWGCFRRKVEWDPAPFLELLSLYGSQADMIVIPDIVAGGARSLERSLSWVERLQEYDVPLLLPVQDGMDPKEVEPILEELNLGIFLGGSSNSDFRQLDNSYAFPPGYDSRRGGWKERTMPVWGDIASRLGCWLHVARVNSKRRIRLVGLARGHSFDGTSVTQFPKTIHKLESARANASRQVPLF